ncbi:MAG: hypothetical protein QXO69_02605 [archaeon]
MSRLFSRTQHDDASIITREEVLMPEYYPAELLHREAEMQAIAEAIKPLFFRQTRSSRSRRSQDCSKFFMLLCTSNPFMLIFLRGRAFLGFAPNSAQKRRIG